MKEGLFLLACKQGGHLRWMLPSTYAAGQSLSPRLVAGLGSVKRSGPRSAGRLGFGEHAMRKGRR
jgi:hypothetical protein